ncbi:MAG: glyceraldehyde-3-phosphate dehydrogenase, glyceraldehyde 3-phosphate dehydrogenase [Candidatus Gottesmanbacteria bacterium GW2011_GWA2_43_14]|uniref:Glyceraldehyde-3-phosphate dehydrogenase, glyceraldehyde 3-phosphate dehydrogenase n=1 Tax=Candidatus Gottesmanbacteria bacterium GW2011_GWA2_43_14 TaxID=1618443 RepID=A0A0G1DL64_9BACT|nr:MAG: glyceraldehyde-3-phosphate dehydrogenase, glyceraldehyde 3-phosphate dehydrogenase [Candidatus Gottesmanbacteria bacterium GW2011_GWA2_43_14]
MPHKKVRIGLNGFGRIGRIASRIILERQNLELSAINSRSEAESHAYLLKYDSVYGTLSRSITAHNDRIIIDGKKISVFKFSSPDEIPWSQAETDIVIDASGKFRTSEVLSGHLRGSVRQVILSAPAKDSTKTIVLGVNDSSFKPDTDLIISNSSCTTNCLASILKPLISDLGIKRAFMTTVHAVTDSQNLLDNSHPKEERLRRSVLASMIPASTGSARDIVKLFPQLKNKIICKAIRIPTATVSLVILTAETVKNTDIDALSRLFTQASNTSQKDFLEFSREPLVSVDFKGNTHSAIVDAGLTEVLGNNQLNIYAWYDNEWGYASRLVDLAEMAASKRNLL